MGRICKHHERLKEQYKSNPDIDPSRTKDNYHIVRPAAPYRKLCLDRIEEAGAKRRKDSVVLQDGLITASPDWLKKKSVEEQKEFFNFAYDFVRDRYGEKNILSAVVHMDEATPHMHFVFVPITKDNRLSSKEIIGGPRGMMQMQDDFYAYIHERYPDIDRGIPKSVTHREHVPVYMYKNAEYLFSHYEEICAAINDIGLIGNAKKKDEAIALLGKYAPEMAKLKVQLESTDRKIKRMEGSLDIERTNTQYFKAECKEKEQELDFMNAKLYELNRRQKELQHKIDLIPPELMQKLEKEEKERRKLAQRTR